MNMGAFKLTSHAVVRMAQRGIKDSDLLELIGTEISDGYLIAEKDYQDFERDLKLVLDRARRLRGTRWVVVEGHIVTAYRPPKRNQRRLLRVIRADD